MQSFTNKRILITGAGHGLGLETAKAFAREGAFVVVTDRDYDRVSRAVAELRREGCCGSGYLMDVTDEKSVRLVREQIVNNHGPIDVLVNNAGIVNGGEFLDVPVSRHLATYAVNMHGPVIVTHVFLSDLLSRPEAHIVNIASASAMIALPKASTYASSKWGVLGFTDSLREEFRQTGKGHVGVSAICPGYLTTGMFDGVKAPFLVPMLTPDKLAEKIVTCVRRKRHQLMTPFLVRLLPLARATWPRSAFRWLLRILGSHGSMEQWKGHQPGMKTIASDDDVLRCAS